MMENAGRGLAAAVREHSPERVVVVAGNGGNGGGGLACARHLANPGVDVRVLLDRPRADLTGTAATQLGILEAAPVPVLVAPEDSPDWTAADVVVDALVGYGLDGALRGTARTLVESVNETDATALSLDVPSGLDATTGQRSGPAVDADRVATLALPKTGLAAADCPVTLLDIGIPAGVFERAGVEHASPFRESDAVAVSPPDA